jgi:hypothetical protein
VKGRLKITVTVPLVLPMDERSMIIQVL